MKAIPELKRRVVFSKYKGKCAYCGCDIDFSSFHVDHINPKFRGTTQDQLNSYKVQRIKGKDGLENLNPSCASCNCSKSTFTIEKWRSEIEQKKLRLKRDSSSYNIMLRFGLITENDIPVLFHYEKV